MIRERIVPLSAAAKHPVSAGGAMRFTARTNTGCLICAALP
jgi:hypothetical protein